MSDRVWKGGKITEYGQTDIGMSVWKMGEVKGTLRNFHGKKQEWYKISL